MVIKKQIVQIPMLPTRKFSRQPGDIMEKPEEIMRTLRRVSQSLGVQKVKGLYVNKATTRVAKLRVLVLLTVSLLSIAWGLTSLIITPLEMLLSIRLQMSPGLPPYEWWVRPPDEVLLKVYVFNVTNPEAFLNGTDAKFRLQEIGPLIYREKLIHKNVRHNPNGTLTYTANRTAVFLPEMNTVDLNAPITVPNLGVLLIPAYFHDSTMFVKLGVNVLLRTFKAKPLVRMSIRDYLWNATDPILIPAEKLAPSLVPTTNVGLLNIIYGGFENNVTVFIGSEHGNAKFFTIDTYDGSPYLPHFSDPKCPLKFRNATEGLCYPQMMTKQGNLTYWRRTLCKQADIRYKRDDRKYGIDAYRFELAPWNFDRVQWEGNEDCFAGDPALPNGLADVSPCYWGFPIAASFPHYLYGSQEAGASVEGLNPNEEDHGSFTLIEPITGTPLEGKARSQINLVMKKMRGFPADIQRFSEKYIPLAWLEYHQVGIPWYLKWLVYYVAVIVPVGQVPFSIFSLAVGGACVYFTITNLVGRVDLTRNQGGRGERLKRESQALIEIEEDA